VINVKKRSIVLPVVLTVFLGGCQQVTQTNVTPPPESAHPSKVIPNPSPLDTESSDLIVKQFYYDMAKKDYDGAWVLLHEAVHRNPSGSLTKEAFINEFKSFDKQLDSAKVIQQFDEYKFPGVQLTLANVDVVEAKFMDGTVKTLHLAKSQNKGWRLFWDPRNGME
jgi:hypothetical protein